jgi:hypothetical protein
MASQRRKQQVRALLHVLLDIDAEVDTAYDISKGSSEVRSAARARCMPGVGCMDTLLHRVSEKQFRWL